MIIYGSYFLTLFDWVFIRCVVLKLRYKCAPTLYHNRYPLFYNQSK